MSDQPLTEILFSPTRESAIRELERRKRMADFTSTVNDWKSQFTKPVPAPVRMFAPLRSYPFVPHARQQEIDSFMRWPSGPSAKAEL